MMVCAAAIEENSSDDVETLSRTYLQYSDPVESSGNPRSSSRDLHSGRFTTAANIPRRRRAPEHTLALTKQAR